MHLINCEIEFILVWSENCAIIYTNADDQVPTFTITETNLYVPVVTLSTQVNSKLLPQLKNGLKRTITWNKYIAKPELLAKNANLNNQVFKEYIDFLFYHFKMIIKEQVIKDTTFQM